MVSMDVSVLCEFPVNFVITSPSSLSLHSDLESDFIQQFIEK